MLIMKETLGESNLNFVKKVPMRYVNLIAIVVSVSDKNKRPYSPTDLRVSPQTLRKIARNTCTDS